MKIAFFEIEDWQKNYFDRNFSETHKLFFFTSSISNSDLSEIKYIEVMVISVCSQITKDVLDYFPNLKYIATRSTGFDHIDLEECKKRKILVSNVPFYAEITVAEHTFALILSISRRIIESYKRVKEGKFSQEGLCGFDLADKTLGVIGLGNIGKHVVKIARCFDMNVLVHTRTPDKAFEKKLGFAFVEIDELLAKSDIISLHIPYSDQTHHFLNKEKFNKMKKGVVIINTSRGGIIDTKSLLMALESGKVKAAGLDVLEEEPLLQQEEELLSKEYKKEEVIGLVQDHLLLRHPSVIITPHNGFNSQEALDRLLKITEENILGFISGRFKNLV